MPALQIKQELTRLLLTESDPNCVIGIGIRIHFQNKEDLANLLIELRSIAKDDPVLMTKIIGFRAMELLSQYSEN